VLFHVLHIVEVHLCFVGFGVGGKVLPSNQQNDDDAEMVIAELKVGVWVGESGCLKARRFV
jgi:hypothetical protein